MADGSASSAEPRSATTRFQTIPASRRSIPFPGYDTFNSSQINEHQLEQNYFNVAAFQQTLGAIDYQISAFSRYSSLSFTPDPIGDLIFNGVASTVFRSSFLNGIAEDTAFKLNDQHTLRFGFTGSGEVAQANNASTVFPVDTNGDVNGPPFAAPPDNTSKIGWLVGVYAQDEWKINKQLTLNAGLRFDQMDRICRRQSAQPAHQPDLQAVRGHGLPRRLRALFYAAGNGAVGADQSGGVPGNQPAAVGQSRRSGQAGAVECLRRRRRPEIRQTSVGLDAYYKTATDLLDDGQFGQAYTLTAFNYAKGWNDGVEAKVKYQDGNFQAYANVGVGPPDGHRSSSRTSSCSMRRPIAYAQTH